MSVEKWDTYFHSICTAVGSNSPCLSRKIGAILVRDKSIVSTGYNGPPRGIPHCGEDRFMADDRLAIELRHSMDLLPRTDVHKKCPRRLLGFESGSGLHWCIAQHAEVNAISNAARLGVQVIGTTLYLNTVVPCKNCMGAIINAGVVEVVCETIKPYDPYSIWLAENAGIRLRRFVHLPHQ